MVKKFLSVWIPVVIVFGCLCFSLEGTSKIRSTKEEKSFEVDGLYYRQIPNQNECVEVISNPTRSYSGNLYIPEKITHEGINYRVIAVGDYAFAGSDVVTVTLHNNIQRIGRAAFSDCPSFMKLKIYEKMVTVSGVGKVEDALSMQFMTFPEHLVEIADSAFYKGMFERIKIPKNVSSIGRGAFAGCKELKAVFCQSDIPANCSEEAFDTAAYSKVILLVPKDKVKRYNQAPGWKHFAIISEFNQEYFLTGKDPRDVVF